MMNTERYRRPSGDRRQGTATTLTRQRMDHAKIQKRDDYNMGYKEMRNNAPSRRELRERENENHNVLNYSQIGVTGRNTGYKVTKMVAKDSMQLESLTDFFASTDAGNGDESVHVAYRAGAQEEEQDVTDRDISRASSRHTTRASSSLANLMEENDAELSMNHSYVWQSQRKNRESAVYVTQSPRKRKTSSNRGRRSSVHFAGIDESTATPPNRRSRSSRQSVQLFSPDGMSPTGVAPPTPDTPGDLPPRVRISPSSAYRKNSRRSRSSYGGDDDADSSNYVNISSIGDIKKDITNGTVGNNTYVIENDDSFDHINDEVDDDHAANDGNESDVSSSMSLESRLSGDIQLGANYCEEEIPLRNKARRRSEVIKVVKPVVEEKQQVVEEEPAHSVMDDSIVSQNDTNNNDTNNDDNNDDTNNDTNNDTSNDINNDDNVDNSIDDNIDDDMGGGFDDFGANDDDDDDDDDNDDVMDENVSINDESRVETMNDSVDMSFKKPNRTTTVTANVNDSLDESLDDSEEEQTTSKSRRQKKSAFYKDWNPNASRADADLDTSAYVKADGWFDPKDPSGKGNYNDDETDAEVDDVNNKSLMSGSMFDARPGDLTTELSQKDVASLPKGRPRRRRMRPLEWWRNERVVYARGEQVCEVKKVIVRSPAVVKMKSRTRARKDKIFEAPCVINPDTGKEDNQITVVVGRKEVQDDLGKDTNQIRNVVAFDEDNFVSGKILIRPGSRTKRTNRSNSTECFYVISGTVSVNLHNSDFELNAGGFFYVPKGNWFRLSNRHKTTVSLAFFMARGE